MKRLLPIAAVFLFTFVCMAQITISAQDGRSHTFRRVSFGRDNRFPLSQTFLRFEEPGVCQVFRKDRMEDRLPATLPYPDLAAQAHGQYYAYWLTGKEPDGSVILVLSRQPIADLAGAALLAGKDVLECEAVAIATYYRDSLWNTDRRPIKPLVKVEKVEGDQISIDDRIFKWEPASLEDVARLLDAPEGRIPLHRIYAADEGQKDEIKAFAARIREQLQSAGSSSR